MGYRTMYSENGITPSMSALGRLYNNACTESHLRMFQENLVYRQYLKDFEDARETIFRHIE